jgi:hypothetical protein
MDQVSKRLGLILFILCCSFGSIYAAKTDTLVMINGDRLTCEIRKLDKGMLTVKTSDMGTLSIKWLRISYIESKQVLEVTLRDHTRLYGKFIKSDSAGYATVRFGAFQETHSMTNIVSIGQVGTNFWAGLDGSVDYGISYASGTENLQSNFTADINYPQKSYKHRIRLNSNISQGNTNATQKQDATYYLNKYIWKRGFIAGNLGWEQNTELGINSRVITGIGLGFEPVDNNVNFLTFSIGPQYNREYTNEGEINNSIEASVTLDYYVFFLYKPKISFQVLSTIYTSFDSGQRFRSNVDLRLTWEVFHNFTLSGTYSNQYDSDPSSTDAQTTNYSYTTALGYSF